MRKLLLASVSAVCIGTMAGCILPAYSGDPVRRARELIFTSEDLRALMLEWEVIHDGAKKFLDYRDRAERQAKAITALGSDLIQLDIERFSQMANLHALCQDCAVEQGTDPKRCDFLKRDLQWASK